MLTVTFHGVRGSTPAPGDATRRYGGNTACVVLAASGPGPSGPSEREAGGPSGPSEREAGGPSGPSEREAGGPSGPSEREAGGPIVLDMGTGFRSWGETLKGPSGPSERGTQGESVRATVLVTHLHFDHVQGLPFFEPIDREGSQLDVYGPQPEEGRLSEAFANLVRPPYFPVRTTELRGAIRFHEVEEERLTLGEATVTVRSVPHLGLTNGYRIDWGGVSVAYISDHQAPPGLDRVPQPAIDLAEGVDLLIHDAQFTTAEWQAKADWGHSTVDYAVLVAREAGARRLALFHHDPSHDDGHVDRLLMQARRTADRLGVDEVLAAAEGHTLTLGPDD